MLHLRYPRYAPVTSLKECIATLQCLTMKIDWIFSRNKNLLLDYGIEPSLP